LAAPPQLELANMMRTGELIKLWTVASQTDLTFNLVSFASRLKLTELEWSLCCQQPLPAWRGPHNAHD